MILWNFLSEPQTSYNQNWHVNSELFRPVYGDLSGGRVKCEISNEPEFLAAEFVFNVYH